jgi:hypothetical protein
MIFKGMVLGVMCALNKGIERHSVFSSSVQSVRTVVNMTYEQYVDPWVGRMVQGKQRQGTGGRGEGDAKIGNSSVLRAIVIHRQKNVKM